MLNYLMVTYAFPFAILDERTRELFLSEISFYEGLTSNNLQLFPLWKQVSFEASVLSMIARMILSIPATSSSNERDFRIAGLLDDPLRSNMHSEAFTALVMLRSYNKPEMQSFFHSQ
eukprot:TRINITY_DN728_c0_g1_i2.p1 TRINITY_DN728_c0_g1~~TRINITY_DN728_c0_g1_i2.p1  ORF type:complete len:117 (+),score=23.41 TRINITY_DN728_c0_g1_i2:442-792(+)